MTTNNGNKLFAKTPLKLNPYVLTIAVLLLIIIITLSGRRSFEKTYDLYIEAIISGDAEAVVELLHDSYISNLIDKGEIDSKYDLTQKLQQKLDWYFGHGERHHEDDYEYFAELQSMKEQDMDAKILPIDLTSPYGESISKVKEAKRVSIYYMCNNCNDAFHSELIYFVKIGHTWYLGEIARY